MRANDASSDKYNILSHNFSRLLLEHSFTSPGQFSQVGTLSCRPHDSARIDTSESGRRIKNDIPYQANQVTTTRNQRHTHRYARRRKPRVAPTQITFKEQKKGKDYHTNRTVTYMSFEHHHTRIFHSGPYPWNKTFTLSI